ncbi:MAG: Rrf2 family transcriptional regulator [Candidatus Margulisbacteria bacterium]|nr:Rrf2 family transcriptional regulator [Candidatus Margulisiibacteriota bacterium]
MKITRASDYAIRLLSHLAAGEIQTTSEELSGELGIPLNHLAKLVQVLGRRGFLLTRKGRGGGLRLGIDPKKVNVAQVIEAIEGPIVISECILNRKACNFSNKCKARKCLGALKQKMFNLLSGTSIADLALQYN